MSQPLRIVCLGAGPGGLYFALLMKRADPRHDVRVVERNRPDDTFGFGVVFSDATIAGIADADSEAYAQITRHLVHWDDIAVYYGGAVETSTGHGFSGMGRHTLLNVLQDEARPLGVRLEFEREMEDAVALRNAIVDASDGGHRFSGAKSDEPVSAMLARAMAAYELARRPQVESLQRAAQASLQWFEDSERYAHLDPLPFAFTLLTRSLRITHEDLRTRDPKFLARVDAYVAEQAERQAASPVSQKRAWAPPSGGPGPANQPPPRATLSNAVRGSHPPRNGHRHDGRGQHLLVCRRQTLSSRRVGPICASWRAHTFTIRIGPGMRRLPWDTRSNGPIRTNRSSVSAHASFRLRSPHLCELRRDTSSWYNMRR